MAEVTKFLKPKLVGARFDGHRVPLEILKDLAVFEQMVVEVARWQYLQEHPGRKRSPKGFSEGLSVKLAAIEDGSAVLDLVLEVDNPELFPRENQEYFERARDSILSAIDAAEKGQPITQIPENLLNYFDRLGRGLREHEAIVFRPDQAGAPATLDRRTRRRLALAPSAVQELTDEITLRGSIPKADQDAMQFELHVLGGPKVPAPLELPHLDTVLRAFEGYRSGAKVLLHGIGRYDRQNRLKSIDAVAHLSLLESNDVPVRLYELRLLKQGWLDGEHGLPLPSSGVDWLEREFESRYPDTLLPPYLYPTAEGGVQAEWSLGRTEITLEIDLIERLGQWHALNLDSDEEVARDLRLSDEREWSWISEQIRTLATRH